MPYLGGIAASGECLVPAAAGLPQQSVFPRDCPHLMPTLHLVHADGRAVTIEGASGRSLMQAAVSAGIEAIVADCGGTLSCATCHVMLDEPWRTRVPAPTADEDAMLELTAAPREAGSRLSCQITLDAGLDGLVVRLPSRQY